ncbi:MAG: very short patch repair endonuclease [Pyrinomonadaceae bacterium]
MADVFSKKKRSEVMSKIKSADTTPELIVRRHLFSQGFRYRLHVKTLPGKPDIVLKKYNTVIFVNGCFWHGHKAESCNNSKMPKANAEFWQKKILTNKKRDTKVQKALKDLGWEIVIIWECDLKKNKASSIFKKLIDSLLNSPQK